MAKNDISETGLKGYLKWLKQDQPGLYQRVANAIAQSVPKGFSDYNQTLVAGIRRTHSARVASMRGLGAIGTDENLYLSDPFYADSYGVATPAVTETSDAANMGSTSSTVGDTIAAIVNGATTGYLTVQQAQQYAAINQAQIQRMQSGLPPATVSSTASGIPLISGPASLFGGGSSGLFPLVLIGGLIFVLATGKKRSA
jgi:hypothetical protein